MVSPFDFSVSELFRVLSECMHHTFPLAVLQSIYGDNAIHLWHGSRVGSPESTSDSGSRTNGMDTIRYVVSLKYVSPSVLFLFSFSFTINLFIC